jgi:hypothetical protein
MNLQKPQPTRKQRFEAALKLAGMTTEQWCTEYHVVSRHHLNECFRGNRDFGPELTTAIDRFIRRHLTSEAA